MARIVASFEKAYYVIEQNLPDDKKELTTTTLRSIALNYIERKGPSPPRALRRALNQLKKRSDIVVTKPDKGTGVVVMNKSQYTELLKKAFINNEEKFQSVSLERPKSKSRRVKHYHPLLQKEKEIESAVRKILPKQIADAISPKGSRLARMAFLRPIRKNWQCVPSFLPPTPTTINLQNGSMKS